MAKRKVAIVTGARRGIGRGIGIAMAKAGFDILINDVERDTDAEMTLESIAGLGAKTAFVVADLADLSTHIGLVDEAARKLGPIDCLVNNAGVMSIRGEMLDVTPEDFDRVLGVNLRGTFFLTQAVARRMVEDGRQDHLRTIITITSANSVMVSPEKTPYCISKSALSMVTQLYGVRLAEYGIAAFEIRPGFISTEMSSPVRDRFTAMIENGATPIKRWGEPADVGETVANLAKGALPYSIGQPIHVDGGLLVHRL